jgi:hypothetical protein
MTLFSICGDLFRGKLKENGPQRASEVERRKKKKGKRKEKKGKKCKVISE